MKDYIEKSIIAAYVVLSIVFIVLLLMKSNEVDSGVYCSGLYEDPTDIAECIWILNNQESFE